MAPESSYCVALQPAPDGATSTWGIKLTCMRIEAVAENKTWRWKAATKWLRSPPLVAQQALEASSAQQVLPGAACQP